MSRAQSVSDPSRTHLISSAPAGASQRAYSSSRYTYSSFNGGFSRSYSVRRPVSCSSARLGRSDVNCVEIMPSYAQRTVSLQRNFASVGSHPIYDTPRRTESVRPVVSGYSDNTSPTNASFSTWRYRSLSTTRSNNNTTSSMIDIGGRNFSPSARYSSYTPSPVRGTRPEPMPVQYISPNSTKRASSTVYDSPTSRGTLIESRPSARSGLLSRSPYSSNRAAPSGFLSASSSYHQNSTTPSGVSRQEEIEIPPIRRNSFSHGGGPLVPSTYQPPDQNSFAHLPASRYRSNQDASPGVTPAASSTRPSIGTSSLKVPGHQHYHHDRARRESSAPLFTSPPTPKRRKTVRFASDPPTTGLQDG